MSTARHPGLEDPRAGRPEPVETTFARAVGLQQRGELEEAAALYDRLLARVPALSQARNNRGVIRRVRGDVAGARADFEAAVRAQPLYAEARNNLGMLLGDAGEHDAAMEHFRAAISARPEFAGALNNLGATLLRQERSEEALGPLRAAATLCPEEAEPLLNLGNALFNTGRVDEAAEVYERLLSIHPEHPDGLNNMGGVKRSRQELPEAIDLFRRAVARRPGDEELLANLGLALREANRLAESVEVLRAAVEASPESSLLRGNLAATLQAQGNLDDAREEARRCLELNETMPEPYSVLGNCALEELDPAEAIRLYERALEFDADDATTLWNRGLARLMSGDWPGGWYDCEHRWRMRTMAADLRQYEQPAWDGGPLDGRTILLYSEQGLGDTLQFVRFARVLKERWDTRVVVECQHLVAQLFEGLDFVDTVVPRGDRVPPFDVHAPLMSVPALLHLRLEEVPSEVPYLRAGSDRAVQSLVKPHGLRVGIVWAGRPEHRRDAHRSVALGALAPLADLPGVQLYSLQKGAGADQLPGCAFRGRITDLGANISSFLDTAAAIASLDLVVTVDTSVAHLAGALGKPVWILLSHMPDWRWMLDRDDTPWYPTARLFRQPSRGEWAPVIERVTAELRKMAAASGSAAVSDVGGGVDVATRLFLDEVLRDGDRVLDVSEPGALSVDGILANSPGNVMVRVSRAEALPDLLASAPEAIAAGRLHAVIWPRRLSDDGHPPQADRFILDTLGGFGFQHFELRTEDGEVVLDPLGTAARTETIFSLAPALVEPAPPAPQRREAPEPLSESVPDSPPIGLDCGVGTASGWGTYGLQIALHALRTRRATPVLFDEPTLSGFSTLQRRLADAALRGSAEVRRALREQPGALLNAPFPVLRALGNGLQGTPISERVRASADVGLLFMEDTHLDSAALSRGERFEKIVVGSSWNEAVLRAAGLTRVETVLQGVDATIFHPAPRAGWLGDRFVVFSGGKLEFRKGQDLVVAAFREFHARHPEAMLMVAWHNFWPATMAEVERCGYVRGAPRVDAAGALQLVPWLVANGVPETAVLDLGLISHREFATVIREADVGLFPNRCEGGTNLVAMETMASGVPVILSANTGHLDLIGGAECYELREQRPVAGSQCFTGLDGWGESSVEEIVARLEEVHTDRERARQCGLAGAEFLSGLSWARQIDRLFDAIEELR